MNSRERILRALNHEEADRVPIDVGATGSSSLTAVAYAALRRHLSLQDQVSYLPTVTLFDVWQQLATIDTEIMDRLHADARPVNRLHHNWWLPGLRLDQWHIGELTDGTPALVPQAFHPVRNGQFFELHNHAGELVAKRGENAHYYDHVGVYHPLESARSTDQLKALYRQVFPNAARIDEEEAAFVASLARKLRETTEHALVLQFGGSAYEIGQYTRGYKQWFLDIGQDRRKGMASCLIELVQEATLCRLKRLLEIVGDTVDIVTFVDDLGTQTASQISPTTYRDLIKPVHATWWGCVHEKSDCRVMLHSCGSIIDLLPDMIDAGVDIINPVHTNAEGMDPCVLKSTFGDDLVFWGGGCDTQRVLPFGTSTEVEREVKSKIDILAPGGGFVFAPVHNVQSNIPPERILLVYDTAFQHGASVYA